ncbi:hypothetical protein ANN_14374 [Periplaneta americana]|uniref:Uncharacterized protein n=1 Tax=Periplaneta americana TaxID=6978 RepID=A0ABQ8SW56_PERAM|nr:hypothetical protein ANN_14374 [Periplaneta americana]
MTSLMIHRCRNGSISLQRWWQSPSAAISESDWFLYKAGISRQITSCTVVSWRIDETYPGHWIGCVGVIAYSPKSPDHSPLDYCVWGWLKSQVYICKVEIREEVLTRILHACAQVKECRSQLRSATQQLSTRAAKSELLIKKIRREGVCAGDEKLQSPQKNRPRELNSCRSYEPMYFKKKDTRILCRSERSFNIEEATEACERSNNFQGWREKLRKVIRDFTIVGSYVDDDDDDDDDDDNNGLFNLAEFYKTMALPVLTYGSESWIIKERDKSKLQAAEMRFLRRVKGCTRRDLIRNEDIRKELNIYNINDKVEDYKGKWKEHLSRMDNERIPALIQQYQPKGKRDVGRPRKRWN